LEGKDQGKLDSVQVLLRVTEHQPKRTATEVNFIENVTRFNNTQNPIKLSDFRSNDSVQLSIAKHFAEIGAVGGNRFHYRHKRTDAQDTPSGRTVIKMEEFIKTVHAFYYGPDDVFGGTEYIFGTDVKDGYRKLFGDEKGIVPSLDSRSFKRLAGAWFLCSYVRSAWKDRAGEEPWLERRWMFYYALGSIVRLEKDEEIDDFMIRLGGAEWTRRGEGSKERAEIDKFVTRAFYILEQAYLVGGEKTASGHRNWFRDEQTLLKIQAKGRELNALRDAF